MCTDVIRVCPELQRYDFRFTHCVYFIINDKKLIKKFVITSKFLHSRSTFFDFSFIKKFNTRDDGGLLSSIDCFGGTSEASIDVRKIM